jgi:pyruvate/2-oxoglutarate dehydrogenase complex dihydrolipoamide acyltransferase (E2) component
MTDSSEAPEPKPTAEPNAPAPPAPEPEGSTTPEAHEPGLNPEPPAPDDEGPDAPAAPTAGWYPDPNAGGANLMRYWDGNAWTDRVQGGSEVSATRRTADERKIILSQQLQTAAARGLRIESQSDFQAVLVGGKPVNHTLHAILTIFTCLLWGIVWAVIAATGGETREMVVVDEFGNVIWQKLGKV